MKKFAKILAISLVCVLAVVALVACAPTPNKDYDSAKKNLEDKKYDVDACKSGDEGSEEAFASIIAEYGLEEGDIEAMLSASNEEGEMVNIIWCTNESAAKKLKEAAEKEWEENKEEIEAAIKNGKAGIESMKAALQEDPDNTELQESIDLYQAEIDALTHMIDTMVFGISGKIAWMGTKAGIKATK